MLSTFPELIETRRSIREYVPQEITETSILSLLNAARWAPSAHNAQPWHFLAITDNRTKIMLAEAMAKVWVRDLLRDGVSSEARKKLIDGSRNRFSQAPLLILAAINMLEMDKYPDKKRRKIEHLMATQSLAAAIQNMLLAAHSMGFGSCWFCAPLFCQHAVRTVLDIPDNIEPQALITIGYPSERPDKPPRKSVSDIAFKNIWGETF